MLPSSLTVLLRAHPSTLSGHHCSSVAQVLPEGAGSLTNTWWLCALTSPGCGAEHWARTAGSQPPHPPAALPKPNKRPTAPSMVRWGPGAVSGGSERREPRGGARKRSRQRQVVCSETEVRTMGNWRAVRQARGCGPYCRPGGGGGSRCRADVALDERCRPGARLAGMVHSQTVRHIEMVHRAQAGSVQPPASTPARHRSLAVRDLL